jgi:hypothetical protein
MPHALGSSGGQVGIGSMLVRAEVTLFWVEADDVWVVAAAPVSARTTTRVRIASFMELAPWEDRLVMVEDQNQQNR